MQSDVIPVSVPRLTLSTITAGISNMNHICLTFSIFYIQLIKPVDQLKSVS